MLRLEKIVINGVEYYPNEDQQPEGLYDYTISFKRDNIYYGFDLSFDIDVKFYCSSFKDKLDETFFVQGVDNDVDFYFNYYCGGYKEMPFVFKGDFRTYQTDVDVSSLKLISKTPFTDYLDIDENNIELDANLMKDVWVRKVSIPYVREAIDFEADCFPNETIFIDNQANGNPISSNSRFQSSQSTNPLSFFILPQSKIVTNELEEGVEIVASDVEIKNTGQFPAVNANKCFNWNLNQTPFGSSVHISNIEPEPIFINRLDDGNLLIKETGSDLVNFNFLYNSYNIIGVFEHFRSILLIGKDFNNPRKVIVGNLMPNKPIAVGNSYWISQFLQWDYNAPIVNIPFSNNSNANFPEISVDVRKGESVWHTYELRLTKNATNSAQIGTTYVDFHRLKVDLDRTLIATFKIKDYIINNITDVSEPSHTSVKLFKAKDVSDAIFSLDNDNFFNQSEYDDFYFTNGSYVRKSTQPKKVNIKPRDFFKSLESIAPVGLGLFYNGTSYELNLDVEKSFWSDNIYMVYDFVDNISFKVGNVSYNDFEIGYETYKETMLSKHKKNEYNIATSRYRSKYSKVSKFIADAYVWAVQLISGTDIDAKPNDNNIFILSAKNLGTSSSPKIVSLSNSSGFASDGVIEINSNSNSGSDSGLNRRYSTVFCLIRKSMQWLPSLDYIHSKLSNNSVYDSKLKISNSALINNVDVKQDQTLTKTELIDAGAESLFENITISFSTPMSEIEYFDLCENWYSKIGVKDDKNNTYYGHILSAKLSEGVCSFELLKNK